VPEHPEPVLRGTVVGNLEVPWGLVFLRSGDALVGERDTARLVRVRAGGRSRTLGEVRGVSTTPGLGEGGLLGLALAPGDEDTLFAYFTTGADVTFEDGTLIRVEGPWTPGRTLARLTVDGRPLVMKVDKATGGFRLRTRGADLRVHVRTPREAELAALMPEKLPPDTSRSLLCPMPGLLTRLLVSEGDEVEEGQALATIEAMKMENTLKAERTGRVSKVRAAEGETLAVDQVILDFA